MGPTAVHSRHRRQSLNIADSIRLAVHRYDAIDQSDCIKVSRRQEWIADPDGMSLRWLHASQGQNDDAAWDGKRVCVTTRKNVNNDGEEVVFAIGWSQAQLMPRFLRRFGGSVAVGFGSAMSRRFFSAMSRGLRGPMSGCFFLAVSG